MERTCADNTGRLAFFRCRSIFSFANMPSGLIVQIRGQVPWQYFQDPKSRRWIGINPLLKLTVEEQTQPALFETMNEAANAFFKELLETGDFTQFLREQGLGIEGPPPPARTRREVNFDVPLNTERISPRDLEKAFR